ncbi:PaaI family thioesterase [Desulforhopalus singaporensis]|uniref:PaaI family thioesterase n=1 Tax=Desulforhopalus singaporensis TaxID=91360 RepID=UPI000B856793|nr:PaaI family thioesterase [Desulforhopalus singaporensis]
MTIFAQYLGIQLVEAGRGHCKVCLPLKKHFLNAANVVHGGVIFALADVPFAIALNSHGKLALAINAHISFLKSKSDGTLYAEAKEINEPHRLGAYDVLVEKGEVIAKFSGMVYRKK